MSKATYIICLSALALLTSAQANAKTATAKTSEMNVRASPTMPVIEGQIRLLDVKATPKAQIPQPPVIAKVDLSEQKMRVYLNGNEVHSWKVSTARKGYSTPQGDFTPYRMHTMWHSRKYNNSPMPYAVFFHKGWAIHGTNAIRRLGRPASHGCVRLHPKNAQKLFNLIKTAGGMKAAKVLISK